MAQLANTSTVTQLTIPGFQPQHEGQLEKILPKLAKYGQQDRWIVMLDAPQSLSEFQFIQFGIDPNKILMIRPTEHQDKQQILDRLLAHQTASAIVVWNEECLDSPEVSSTRVFQITNDNDVPVSGLVGSQVGLRQSTGGWRRRCQSANLVNGPWS